jgi:choline-glycine betaine transporter
MFLISLVLIFFFPSQIVLTFRAHWLLLIGAIVLAFTPLGKIRLEKNQQKTNQQKINKPIKFYNWLFIVFLAQVSITLVYRGLVFVVAQGLPLQTSYNLPNLFALTEKTLLWQSGFFPGALYLLVGIALAYVGFYQGKPGKISFTLMPILKNKIDDSTSLAVDFITRIIAHFCIATTIGFTALLALALLAQIFAIHISLGQHMATLLIATLLLIAINTKEWFAIIRFLVDKKIPIAVIAILFIILSAGVLLILNAINNELIVAYPLWNKPLTNFVIPHWEQYWLILSGIWLLCWTPLIAGLIAYCSRGYQIRTVIFGGLLVMLINNELFIYLPNNTLLNYLLPCVGMLILLTLFLRKDYLMYQIRAIVPGTQIEKPRPLIFYTFTLTQVAAFMLILYMPVGIFALSILMFALAFPLAIILVMSAVSLFCPKKRAQ